MSTTDEALTEQIARATCGSPSDYEWRTWGEDDPDLRAITLQYAARLLPTIRKAERDAAREALDGLARYFASIGEDPAAYDVRNWRDTHYPEDVTP